MHKWDRWYGSFFDLMTCARKRLTIEEFEFFSCIVYLLWGQSNKVTHEGIVSNPIVVVQRASKLLKDYRDVLVIRGIYGQVDGRVAAERISQDHVWMPPGEGFMKVVHAHFLTKHLNRPPIKYLGLINYLIN